MADHCPTCEYHALEAETLRRRVAVLEAAALDVQESVDALRAANFMYRVRLARVAKERQVYLDALRQQAAICSSLAGIADPDFSLDRDLEAELECDGSGEEPAQ